MKILIFTDSRGQHKPAGSVHNIFPERLARDPRFVVDNYLCPFKWTTTLDFLGTFDAKTLAQYDLVILYTGIVDWSPRPQKSAVEEVYNHPNPHNLGNLTANTGVYSQKVVNNKKRLFDSVFGKDAMQRHFSKPFDVIYEGSPTQNLYSLEMAERHLIPKLREIPNLLFINANRIVSGWDGDYWKKRPENISMTHQYAELFSRLLPAERLIDLSQWTDNEVQRYTCDNIHLSAEGSDFVFNQVVRHIEHVMNDAAATGAAQESLAGVRSPHLTAAKLLDSLSAEERERCERTALVIGVRFRDSDPSRLQNLLFLLDWLQRYYSNLFDILILEQDDRPRLPELIPALPAPLRYVFAYNPHDYNRGWGYNVAVKHHCPDATVVALMDTDVLTGEGFVRCVLDCHDKYDAVSPYRNIYYSDEQEAARIRRNFSYAGLNNPRAIKNPVTITGGVVILKKDVFLRVSGFEQYIGYGCEDRALDVTLLNVCGADRLHVAGEIYVHLYHPADKDARKNFKDIYRHLTTIYKCQYDPSIGPVDFIHKNCTHASGRMTQLMNDLRATSFGDSELYRRSGVEDISINGLVVADAMKKNETFLPRIHHAMRERQPHKALELCQLGIQQYGGHELMLKIFQSKLREIERLPFFADVQVQRLASDQQDTLIILGNGPSLKYVMSNPVYREILKKYHTFGLNAAYRAYDELNFWPTYHGCLDMIVVESHLRSYEKIVPRLSKMFLLAEDHLGKEIIDFDHPNLVKIRFDKAHRDSNEKALSTRFDEFRNWQNSGCNCVQIGLMLGYKRVILLGMDANYKELLSEADVVKDEKYKWDHLQITRDVQSNDNYWFSGYQQVGDKYNIPNAAKYHLPAWNALGLSEHGPRIINCTTETKISTLRRQSFEETFDVRPAYSSPERMVLLQALEVEPKRLLGQIIRHQDRLYLLVEDNGTLVRRFVTEAAWRAYTEAERSVDVFEVDEHFMHLPCHGVADSIAKPAALRPGLTFMIRARNERTNVYFVLGSLKHVLANPELNCEVLFVDNRSDDGTFQEVQRICRQQGISNVFLTRYDVDVCPSGDAHTKLKANHDMARSLDTYYNWCLDRVQTRNVIKWDCDFLAIQSNLLEMIRQYDLPNTDEALAIWCTGKTLFKCGDEFFINENTMYNEYRVFSRAQGYRWEYAPRWEICSQSYMTKAQKRTFPRAVFLELKDLQHNEFEFRSQGGAILSDVRDKRDHAIINALKTKAPDQAPVALRKLAFNPLQPASFGRRELAQYEASLEELNAMQTYWINVYSRVNAPVRFNHPDNAVVQGLWVGERLGELHRMCVESFVKNGHCFVLYTYGPVANVPDGVVIMDARKLVPESMIYQYDGSYAGFSDLFRNKLLLTRGGWYVDLDIFSVKRYDLPDSHVFSLDYYPEVSIPVRKKSGEIIEDKYYVQTNPVKLPPSTDIAKKMYTFIFTKVLSAKIKDIFWSKSVNASVERDALQAELVKTGVAEDFNKYIGPIPATPDHYDLAAFVAHLGLSMDQIGQSTWGEIGPIMVTREVLAHDLSAHTKKPEMLQGVVKYSEVEKFLDPGFDYATEMEKYDIYSIDLFFTMWRRKGLLDKVMTTEPCLLNHLRKMHQD
jgi:hypothetical protein